MTVCVISWRSNCESAPARASTYLTLSYKTESLSLSAIAGWLCSFDFRSVLMKQEKRLSQVGVYSSIVCSVRIVRRPRRSSKSPQRRKRKDFVSKLAEIIVSDAVVVDRWNVFLKNFSVGRIGSFSGKQVVVPAKIFSRVERKFHFEAKFFLFRHPSLRSLKLHGENKRNEVKPSRPRKGMERRKK